jgi:hypothetical protein
MRIELHVKTNKYAPISSYLTLKAGFVAYFKAFLCLPTFNTSDDFIWYLISTVTYTRRLHSERYI